MTLSEFVGLRILLRVGRFRLARVRRGNWRGQRYRSITGWTSWEFGWLRVYLVDADAEVLF